MSICYKNFKTKELMRNAKIQKFKKGRNSSLKSRILKLIDLNNQTKILKNHKMKNRKFLITFRGA